MGMQMAALFRDLSQAQMAIRDLRDMGLAVEDVSLLAADDQGQYGRQLKSGDQTTVGSVLGAITGFVVGLGTLVIPGIGPVLAAGPLAALLSGLIGAGVGVATGALAGALMDLGVPEDQAQFYVDGVRGGGVVVTVEAEPHMVETIRAVFERHGAVNTSAPPRH